MRLRTFGACAVALVGLATLSACDTKAGAAAVIGGQRINQGEVDKYLVASYTVPPPSPGQQQRPVPRSFALNTLIETDLLTRVLESEGGVPSDGELAALHDEALSVQLQLQQTGAQADATLTNALVNIGLKPSFTEAYLRQVELKQAVIDRIHAQRQSDIAAAENKLGVGVSVSGRYGSWSHTEGQLASYAPPSFIQLGSAPAGSSAPPG